MVSFLHSKFDCFVQMRNAGNVAHVAPSPTAQNAPRDGRKSPCAGIVHPTIIERSAAEGKRFSPSHIGFQPIREDRNTADSKVVYNNMQVPQIGMCSTLYFDSNHSSSAFV
jgi:hypothetical protein